jgi:hypothetical protein
MTEALEQATAAVAAQLSCGGPGDGCPAPEHCTCARVARTVVEALREPMKMFFEEIAATADPSDLWTAVALSDAVIEAMLDETP